MTMHNALHPRDGVERIYVLRKEGGRLASTEDSVDTSIQRKAQNRTDYIRKVTDKIMDRLTIIRKQKWKEKNCYGRFKRLINNISQEKIRSWSRKGNFKRETESLLIAEQNNAIRTNHIKARIDLTLQNSKCRLCDDWDETINHISIRECSKLAQKYKTRHYWVGNVIPWKMCKKFKFDHTNK